MKTKPFFLLSWIVLVLAGLWAGFTNLVSSESQISEPTSLNGPYEQVVYAVATDPTDPNEIYAGIWSDGVYHSDNAGQTWAARDAGLQNRAREVRAIARASGGNRPLYIGTYGQGVYRSDDNGQSWQPLSKFIGQAWVPISPKTNPLFVEALLIDNAASLTPTLYAGTHDGVRKSVDGGTSWEIQKSGLQGDALRIQALAQNPRDHTLYAGTWGDGVYRSRDDGKTWQSTTLSAQGVLTVASLLIDPRNGVLYAGGAFGLGIYRSDDGGATWQDWNNGIANDWRARTVQAIAIDSSGAVYAGTVDYGVYKIADGEAKWQSKSKGLKGYGFSILTLSVAADGKTLYAGTFGGGMYYSTDGGETWETRNSGIPLGALAIQVLASGGMSNSLYAGTDFGVYVGLDEGKTWSRRINGMPTGKGRSIQALEISGTNPVMLYAGTQQGLYRAVDDGKDFRWTLQTIEPAYPPDAVISIIHRGNTFYAAVGGEHPGIYRSDDGGESWNKTVEGLPIEGLRVGINRDSGFSLGLGEGNMVYASLFGRGIYVSRDSGGHWELLPRSPKYVQRLDLARKDWVDWALGAGSRQVLHAQAIEGMYTDQITWTLRFPGAVGVLLADSFHPSIVYAGILTSTQASGNAPGIDSSAVFGVIVSQDDGQTWKLAQRTVSPVTALALHPQNPDVLYIGSLNRGVYQSRVSAPPIWRQAVGAVRLGTLVLAFVLLFDLAVFSLEFRIAPWKAVATLMMPITLSRLLVDPSPLPHLQQLILAFWPGGEARPEDVQKALERERAPTSWTQITSALDDLRQHHLLAKIAGGAYRVQRSAFVPIAKRRFAPHLEILSKAVREESRVYQDAREFFKQAGFLPRMAHSGLSLISPGETEESLYAGVFCAGVLTEQDVDLLLERARDEYQGRLEGRRAYAVIAAPPRMEAYQRLVDLVTGSTMFQVVMISHTVIRQALVWGAAAAELARSEARIAPDANLYAVEAPAIDPLDFFGRQEFLRDIERTLDLERVIGLVGLPRSGKTTLLWQLKERMSNRPCVYVDLALLTGRPGDLARALTDALTAEAQAWKVDWLPPTLSIESPADEANHLARLLDTYKTAMRSQLLEPSLLVLLDTVEAGAASGWKALTGLAAPGSGFQVVLAFDDRPQESSDQIRLLEVMPFSQRETAELAVTLVRPMGRTYQADALQHLYTDTTGHPQLVRQLCSEIATSGQRPPRAITADDVTEAASRYVLRRPPLLYHIWEFLTPIEQTILLHLAGPETVLRRSQLITEAQQALDSLVRLGLVGLPEGNYRIMPELVRAWLQVTMAPAPGAQ